MNRVEWYVRAHYCVRYNDKNTCWKADVFSHSFFLWQHRTNECVKISLEAAFIFNLICISNLCRLWGTWFFFSKYILYQLLLRSKRNAGVEGINAERREASSTVTWGTWNRPARPGPPVPLLISLKALKTGTLTQVLKLSYQNL